MTRYSVAVMSSDDLVAKAVGGDIAALSDLLGRCGPLVRHRLEGEFPVQRQSVVTMDDVMQQSYTDAFLSIRQFRGTDDASFVGWLTALARNNLRDALRMLDAQKRGGDREKIELRAGEDSYATLFEAVGGTCSTASQQAARHEAQSALEQAVGRLPDVYQHVVRCYDLEGQSVEQVAAQIKRSPGAVFMLRARAHRRLAEIMGTASQYLSDSA